MVGSLWLDRCGWIVVVGSLWLDRCGWIVVMCGVRAGVGMVVVVVMRCDVMRWMIRRHSVDRLDWIGMEWNGECNAFEMGMLLEMGLGWFFL
jgi:hypothetical protein